jgi:shikimate kinase/3-dehydroquinate synthase
MSGWIFLSGMMGSGKSTVGRLLAEWNGTALIDLDVRIAARANKSIPRIFADEGEAVFRRLEAEEAGRVIAHDKPTVVALGGGTVMNADTRRLLLEAGVLVTLDAPAGELAARLEGKGDRPLLMRGEAASILEGLLAERAEAYAECHGRVETAGRSVGEIAEEVAAIARANPIVVPLGKRTYRVDVAAGARARLPEHVSGAVLLVTDTNVDRAWGTEIATLLGDPFTAVLVPGEEHKTIRSVETIWDVALSAGLDRRATLVALGGGVVGDLAGFAASTLLRGVRCVQVPTSLLAMVDASVGGKTGFDRSQGKNLIGTFHQPTHVICDIDVLSTLPDAELRSGLAEVVKSAWLDGEGAVASLERDAEALLARDRSALERAVRASVRLKARIVASDERESGARMTLNLGHTLGHAIEAARGYSGIRHGEAVAVGMMKAFAVARGLGGRDADVNGARMKVLLERLGLPIDAAIDERTLAFVGADKKRASGKITFVVPGAPGHTELVPVGLEQIREFVIGGPRPLE